MIYSVTTCDAGGRTETLRVQAESPSAARAEASGGGRFVVSVREAEREERGERAGAPRKVRKTGKRVASFAKELSVLVGTGTPVAESLRAIEKQASEPGWKRVVRDVRTSVEEGTPLSRALGEHPGIFDPIFRSLIAAGESSGKLHELLRRLSAMKRRELKARSLLIGSATYPAVLLTVASSVMVAMVVFVIPRFAGLFETLNAPLPATTRFLLEMSGFLSSWWWALLLGLAGAVVGACFGWRSERVKWHADALLARVPVLGPMAQGFTVARTTRMLGVLLDARVSLLESLELVRRSVTRPLYRAWVSEAVELVTRGESLSGSFSDDALFPPSIREAISNAENSGRLAPVLIDLSEYLDDENEASARTFTNLLEPLIMVVLGGVVAFVALSMFLPLFDLTASAGGGS
ncbi:MAG: type II secretion system F family protein [Phycisphaerales bacterium JB040]